MINISNPAECCGCTACASVCKHKAITMIPDALGFLYPVVDQDKCIDCNLCSNICAFNNNYDKSLNIKSPDVYLARHKNMDEVMNSRSGAVFVAISDYILNQNGTVYGAGYEDHFRVVHKRATTKEERDEFRGSKYVQSDLSGVFAKVEEDLKNGFLVLFSGTGCQCAGLNSYIGKKLRKNLILVDIVCHGVPGPYLWRDYLFYLEKQKGKEIVELNFRDKKKFGWRAHIESYVFGSDNKEKQNSQIFTMLFYSHIAFRQSCGECPFCNTTRPSDFTLADFWDRSNNYPQINSDDKGESLLFVNTEKGREIFNQIKDILDFIQSSTDKVMQIHLQKPSKINPNRMVFEQEYVEHGFESALRKYGLIGWRLYWNYPKTINNKFIRFIVQLFKKPLKVIMKYVH